MNIDRTRFARLAMTFVAVAAAAGPAVAADPPKVGDVAADFELGSLKGGKVKLSELTKQGPVALVVLRGYPGYQCPLCSRQVQELTSQADALRSARSRVVLVYPGPANDLKQRAEEFTKGAALPANFDLLLDPDYAFTKAYGLRWDAPQETAYPSTFVLDGDRKIRFAKISKTHGDRARTADVLKALEGL